MYQRLSIQQSMREVSIAFKCSGQLLFMHVIKYAVRQTLVGTDGQPSLLLQVFVGGHQCVKAKSSLPRQGAASCLLFQA